MFAHVRASTSGALAEINCHPWSYYSLMWMHNGISLFLVYIVFLHPISSSLCSIPLRGGFLLLRTFLMQGVVGNFEKIKRRLVMSLRDEYFLNVQGNTDSEWAFAVFLNELANLGCNPKEQKPGGFGHAILRQAMTNTIASINQWSKEVGDEEPSLLNFALTDGAAVIATRYVSSPTEDPASLFFRYEFPSLEWLLSLFVGDRNNGSSGTSFHQYAPGHFRMERRDKGQDIVLVASEPLTFERADWVTVPANSSPLYPLVNGSHFNDKRTDCPVASYSWFDTSSRGVWLMVDEYHVPDPLHSRRSGFAQSKGQSLFVSAC